MSDTAHKPVGIQRYDLESTAFSVLLTIVGFLAFDRDPPDYIKCLIFN